MPATTFIAVNFIELLIFLLVTASVGALLGTVATGLAGSFLPGAAAGALAGPVIAACIISVYVLIRRKR